MAANAYVELRPHDDDDGVEDDEDDTGVWEDWNEDDAVQSFVCLLCPKHFNSSEEVFKHCENEHFFNFTKLRKTLRLDFYGTFKFINFVRSEVAINRCWTCGSVQQSNEALLNHLKTSNHGGPPVGNSGSTITALPWEDERHLTSFLQDDPLLYSFESEGDDTMENADNVPVIHKEDLFSEIGDGSLQCIQSMLDNVTEEELLKLSVNHIDPSANDSSNTIDSNICNATCLSNKISPDCNDILDVEKEQLVPVADMKKKKNRVSFAKVAEREIQKVNESYFGSYGQFGIHREMLSDEVRMDAYKGAILGNPSLFKRAVVMDVGCGTGILSLFAAQAGAAKVIAVEASKRIASIARQVAKENNMLRQENGDPEVSSEVITIVEGMIEKLDDAMPTTFQGVDVIVSEWMGYCLLYESMLSSVLYARDRWLKPGGAILPDTAELFMAGFGIGGTSLVFWENVHGFNMSCIGKEVLEDAARQPIVDILDPKDIVTETSAIHAFDLMTMRPEEIDFTTEFCLKPKCAQGNMDLGVLQCSQGNGLGTKSGNIRDQAADGVIWCHGLVLWFETGFTSRFCKETPKKLSTSPYNNKTHWSQTLLTFRNPIALCSQSTGNEISDSHHGIGTELSPANYMKGRISIARSYQHRSIDISVEVLAVGKNGFSCAWPVQIFNI